MELDEVRILLGSDYDVSFMTRAGQKSVFRATSQEVDLVVKFVAVEERDEDGDIVPLSSEEERLRREVRLMSSISSEYLPVLGPIELTEHEEEGLKYLYFSERYLGNKNVKDLIRENAFTPELLKQFMHDVASALIEYSKFENGFVHRDIKPANIMLNTATGNFVLIDGGVHMLPSNPTITLSGNFVGTPKYATPEQLLGSSHRSVDPRSDIFSLGIVVYEIAQGSHPFFIRGQDPQEGVKNLLAANYSPITRDGFTIFNNILARMLTQYQHSRYAGPDELLKDIEELNI